ncbi:MAG TPA: hypothetical protein PK677_14830, partial [Acidiphilium sp.]|nr:hypothetical protein [Acidiphilium sp.]
MPQDQAKGDEGSYAGWSVIADHQSRSGLCWPIDFRDKQATKSLNFLVPTLIPKSNGFQNRDTKLLNFLVSTLIPKSNGFQNR